MKKILGLLALIFILSCDDGEMSFKTFNFGTGNPSICGDSNILYKINGTEVLILDLSAAGIVNSATPPGEPRLITLGSGNTITYRNYSDTPTANVICSFPAPSTPSVREEWTGTGTIQIETVAVRNNSNILTGFSHKITLVDVSFSKDGKTTRIVDNDMGSIVIPLGYTFTFGSETDIFARTCPENNLVFRRNTRETVILDFPAGTFPSTVSDTPLDIDLSNLTDDREVYFQVFDGTIADAHVCDVIRPVSPNVIKRFAATSGTVRIFTENAPGGGTAIRHRIYLRNVVFANVSNINESFNIADVVAIPDDNGYVFGILPGQ